MNIGIKIKKIRELRNYTQDFMAEILGVSQSTYSRFEKDEGDLTIHQLNRISEILDIKIEDLINFDERIVFNNYSNNSNQAYTINIISEKERELYEKTISLLEEKIKYLENRL